MIAHAQYVHSDAASVGSSLRLCESLIDLQSNLLNGSPDNGSIGSDFSRSHLSAHLVNYDG